MQRAAGAAEQARADAVFVVLGNPEGHPPDGQIVAVIGAQEGFGLGADGALELELSRLGFVSQKLRVAPIDAHMAVQGKPLLESETGVIVIVLVLTQVEEVPGRADADADRAVPGGQRFGDVLADALGGVVGSIGRFAFALPTAFPIDEGLALGLRDIGLHRLGKMGVVEILAGGVFRAFVMKLEAGFKAEVLVEVLAGDSRDLLPAGICFDAFSDHQRVGQGGQPVLVLDRCAALAPLPHRFQERTVRGAVRNRAQSYLLAVFPKAGVCNREAAALWKVLFHQGHGIPVGLDGDVVVLLQLADQLSGVAAGEAGVSLAVPLIIDQAGLFKVGPPVPVVGEAL